MTRIKSTTVLRQPKDNAESEVVETSTCIDAADASSTFDQDAMRDVLVRGHEDRENSETDGEENGDMDNSKTFEGDHSDLEEEARRKAGAATAAGLIFVFGPLTITKGRICEMDNLNYFLKGDGWVPGEETVPEPLRDEAIVFEDYCVARLRIPTHRALAEIMMKFRIQLHQLTPNVVVQLSKVSGLLLPSVASRQRRC
jgi:hypothetical protein